MQKATTKGNGFPNTNGHNSKGKETSSPSEYPMEWRTKNPNVLPIYIERQWLVPGRDVQGKER